MDKQLIHDVFEKEKMSMFSHYFQIFAKLPFVIIVFHGSSGLKIYSLYSPYILRVHIVT